MSVPLEKTCRVCDAQVADYPDSDANVCQVCLDRLGLCLANACSVPLPAEADDFYAAAYVVVLRGGREIRFTSSAYAGGDWIAPVNLTSVLTASGRKPHLDEKYFGSFTFRLSEVVYAFIEDPD